jgi:hypothetical protein
MTGFSGGAAARYAHLKAPLATICRGDSAPLPKNVVATVGCTYRRKFNSPESGTCSCRPTPLPLTVTEVVSGQTVTVYNQAPALRGRIDNVWDSDATQDSTYQGADINFTKRMSNGWSLMGGASFGRTIGDPVAGDLNNPNNSQYREGIVGNDVPWSYRLSGVYDLPFGIAASGTASYYAGFAENTTVVVNSRTVALTQSTQTVWMENRGDTRLPNVFQLDLAFRKIIRLGAYTLEPRIDMYNMTNNNAVLGRVAQLGPSYGRASSIMNGRLIKIGANLTF